MATPEKIGYIEHTGIVKNADSKSVMVSITSGTACSGCHAEGSCSISGKEEKIIEVPGEYKLSAGDMVTIIMQKSMGYAAVIYGYVVPAVLMICSLIILLLISGNELASGLISIGILIPYYLILYLFRTSINSKFKFSIKQL